MAMTVTEGRGVLPTLSFDEELPSEPLTGPTSNTDSRFTAVLLTPLRSASRSRCRWRKAISCSLDGLVMVLSSCLAANNSVLEHTCVNSYSCITCSDGLLPKII